MNTKSLVLAGAMSLGLLSLADAAQYVYITGSTAARSIVHLALSDTTVFDATPIIVYQGGSSAAKAKYVNYSGNVGGTATIIKVHWSGSEGGIGDMAGNTEQFLDDAASTGGDGPYVTDRPVDIAMADNDVLFSKNPLAPVTGQMVGIIAFKWVAEKGSAASLTNVTDQAIRQALKGNARLGLFTGNPADTTRVFVTGRNSDSGTRVNTFGDSGFGIFTAPKQLMVNTSDGSMMVQSDGKIVGDYGFDSGGSVATQMGVDLSQPTSKDIAPLGDGVSHFSVIGYLGSGDAKSATDAGGWELTLNGVPFSAQNIQQGRYNFWGNEMIYRKNSVSTQAGVVYTKLAASTGIAAHADGSTLISSSSMTAHRDGPTTDPY